ncbi:hypothetical protein AOLI_G00287070 [Acnodon oligacanthus]
MVFTFHVIHNPIAQPIKTDSSQCHGEIATPDVLELLKSKNLSELVHLQPTPALLITHLATTYPVTPCPLLGFGRALSLYGGSGGIHIVDPAVGSMPSGMPMSELGLVCLPFAAPAR